MSLQDEGDAVLAVQKAINRHALLLGREQALEDGVLGDQTARLASEIAYLLAITDQDDLLHTFSGTVLEQLLDPSRREAAQRREAERRQLAMGRALRPGDIIRGTQILKLIGDWDSWVHRRIDSVAPLRDGGYRRSRTLDYTLSDALELAPGSDEIAFPIPMTLAHKWRLPRFDLRDESGRQLPLLARAQHGPIAAGALIAMAHKTVTNALPVDIKEPIPHRLECHLRAIVHEQEHRAVLLCERLSASPEGARHHEAEDRWRRALSTNEPFMEMAYELAQNFIVFAEVKGSPTQRRVITMAYDAPARPPRPRVRRRQCLNWLKERLETASWPISAGEQRLRAAGSLVITAEVAHADDHEGAVVDVEIESPHGTRTTVTVKSPGSSVRVPNLPLGRYAIRPVARPGFQLITATIDTADVEHDQTTQATVGLQQLARPALRRIERTSEPRLPLGHKIGRALAWRSRPELIDLRIGEGGSYHFEYTAPPGLRVTRAKIADNRRRGELAIQLKSGPSAQLYLASDSSGPSTAWALVNLRPRAETVVRVTTAAAALTTLSILAIALHWSIAGRVGTSGIPWLLAIPGGLSAYFAQSSADPVTYDNVLGLRFVGVLPGLLSFLAVGVIYMGAPNRFALAALWGIFALCLVVTLSIALTAVLMSRPPEQRPIAAAQSVAYAQRHLT